METSTFSGAPTAGPGSNAPETAQAVIRPAAIAHNLRQLRDTLNQARADAKKSPSIWAVVKADAYGHGLEHVMAGLGQADGIAVRSLWGAYRVRSLGWRKPVLVISAGARFSREHVQDPALYPLHLVIDNEAQIAELESLRQASRLYIWLRHSGSLNHAGLRDDAYAPVWRRLQALLRAGVLDGVGHMQHYARAEEAEPLRRERRAFEHLIHDLPGARCTENSAALLSGPDYAASADWVRSGIALYGISPLAGVTGPDLGLQPAMLLQAPIYGVQCLPAGQPLGYGGIFRAERDLRIGLVACGYADGYPRSAADNCPVVVNGRPSRVVGRVSMDTITVDLSAHPDAGPGTMVTLWGADDLPIEIVARHAGTIPAQLCSGVTARVPKLAG